MQRRVQITEEQYKELYSNKSKRNDYFVAIGCGNSILFFDTVKEARKFNNQMKKTFNTKLGIGR